MDADAVTAWFDTRVANHEFSGVALATVGDETVFSYAGGVAHRGHGLPITAVTRFRVASISKTPVAATMLRLVERGSVALDTPILDVLPPDWQTASMTRRHTVHHLLSHTSGLANYHDEDDTWTSFTSCWDRVPPQKARRPADLLPLFAERPATADPGERYEYADVNYIIAGMVIEALTSRSFADVIRDEVFDPLGMTDSDFAANDTEPTRLATGYLATDDHPWESWPTNIFSVPAAGMPDGGLITSAADLVTLFRAVPAGELLAPHSVTAMLTPQGPGSDDLEQYGYGCELTVDHGAVTIIGHGGHDPGISTLVSHWIDPDTTIAVLCNHDRGSWAPTQLLATGLGLPDSRS